MPERAQVFEGSSLGFESTFGTAVATTKRLIGTTIAPKIMTEHKTYRPRGSRMVTGGVQNKEWTEADIQEDVALYTDPSYLFAMMMGLPSITAVGGGCYAHAFNPLNFSGILPKAATIESGGFVRARKFPYGVVKTLGMQGDRNGVSLSGGMMGQLTTSGITLTPGTNEVQTLHKTGTVGGGTFTLTFMGEKTSALAFGATLSTVLTAVQGLANLSAADITATGGPAGTADIVFTFGGRFASADVPLIISDSTLLTGGGTYDVTQTTGGAPLASTTYQPISGSQWDFYVDTTAGGIGGTKLTRCFGWSWQISDLFGPVWPGNTSVTSYAAIVDLAPTTSFSFRVEGDSAGDAFLTQMRSGALVFVRIKCTGPTLGSGTYLLQTDFPIEITGIDDNADEDGVYAQTFNGEIAYDNTFAAFTKILIQNDMASL